MNEDFNVVKQTVDSLAKLKFLPVIKNRIKLQREFIDKCRILLLQLQQASETDLSSGKTAILENVLTVNKQIEKLITTYFEVNETTTLQLIFPDFYSALDKFISDSDEKVEEYQDPERFIKGPDDKLNIKIRKPVKKFFYNISNIPISVGNIFRKLFHKPVKEKKIWKRIVLLKSLRQFHLNNNLSLKLIEIARKLFMLRSSSAKAMWNIYESIDENINQKLNTSNDSSSLNEIIPINIQQKISDLVLKLNQFEESLNNEIELSINSVITEYETDYLKAGTIENPGWKLRRGVLKKKNKQISDNALRVLKGWRNNLISLGDDWNMNNELYQIRYNTLVQLEKYSSVFKSCVENNLIPRSNNLAEFIKSLHRELSTANNKSNLLKSYKEIKIRIDQNLTNNLIPDINNAVLDQNLAGLVAEFDNLIRDEVNSIKQIRSLVKTDEYDKEIKDSEINKFSPREIIEYSAAPKFFNTTEKFRTFINSQVQQIQNELNEIDHIADFIVESALNLLDSENDVEKSKTIAVGGLDRAVKKIFEVKNKFDGLSIIFNSELSAATSEFNSELKNLTKTEKIFDIRLSLAKAKALQRSKQVRKKIIENIKNILPQIFWLIRKLFKDINNQYSRVRELLGLTQKAKLIASEVSDYLAETQTAILKLPFVYQRLFEVKPLEDERLFFGRDDELKELSKAFNSWQKEKFSPTIIIGEKGSGSTSLINNFLFLNKNSIPVIRHTAVLSLSDSNEYLELFSDLLRTEKFNSVDDLIIYLNSLKEKHLIIIENLQKLFLRKVDGFNVLKMFFEIISKTNKNIFWLSTCTLYSWKYLNNTINASDYFGYIVNLRKLNEKQITSLVSKRHRISGYSINYEADEHTLKTKSYKKLTEEERQPFLKNKYFIELNKFAQSNISLALVFWLRSAKDIVNDVIKIGSPPELDYSFLENLSSEKIFCLSALLIHDGLKIQDHAEIFGCSVNKSKLLFLLMHDDGIIIEQNGLYIINPLLYRQIVGLLKSRNIIH